MPNVPNSVCVPIFHSCVQRCGAIANLMRRDMADYRARVRGGFVIRIRAGTRIRARAIIRARTRAGARARGLGLGLGLGLEG